MKHVIAKEERLKQSCKNEIASLPARSVQAGARNDDG